MNLSETARLLSMIAAYNNRTIGEADVVAWQSVLPDVPLADAEEAVRRHYAEHTEWMMPAHVRRLVRDIAQERQAMATATGWAPGQAGVPKDQAMPEISGPIEEGALTPQVRALLDSVRAMLPEGSREALMPRTVAWEKEHAAYQRQQDGQPNPHYRGGRGYSGDQVTVDEFVACGFWVSSGPCILRAGHPVGLMYPGFHGHMEAERATVIRSGDTSAVCPACGKTFDPREPWEISVSDGERTCSHGSALDH